MVAKRAKTVSYRRAVWLTKQQPEATLEQWIKKAYKKLKTVADRKVPRGTGQVLKGLHSTTKRSGGIFLHIVAETPGDHASTLSVDHETEESGSVSTAPAPNGSEFMDGDIFLFVKDDHVCICSSGLREATVTFFCAGLFEKAKLSDNSTMFDLQKVAKANKIKLISSEGVREIDLNATLYDATSKYVQR